MFVSGKAARRPASVTPTPHRRTKSPGLTSAHSACAGRGSDQRPNLWSGNPVDDAWHGRPPPPLARTLGSADSAASMAASLASIDRELLYGPPAMDRTAAGRTCAPHALLPPQLTYGQTMVQPLQPS